MPRVGLNTLEVVSAGAELADEIGIRAVTFAALAERLNVQAPALYKHVDGIGDLQHRIATLAMTEFGDALRNSLQGKSGADALAALFSTMQGFINKFPGRYSAVNVARIHDEHDLLFVATTRVIDSIRAVLSNYGIDDNELTHAIRMLRSTIHGYALLKADNSFQWSNDPEETVTWMIKFFNAGLTTMADNSK